MHGLKNTKIGVWLPKVHSCDIDKSDSRGVILLKVIGPVFWTHLKAMIMLWSFRAEIFLVTLMLEHVSSKKMCL